MNPPPVPPSPASPPPLPVEAVPFVESQSSLRAVVSWLVIAACIALMVGVTIVRKGMPPKHEGPSAQQLIGARYAVGASAISRAMTGNRTNDATGAQAAKQLREAAKTDTDRLYAAIVTAAVESKDAARPALEALAASPDEAMARDARDIILVLEDNEASLDASARDRLTDRHAWLGKLALTLNLPSGDPARQAVLDDAQQTSIAMFGFLIVILGVAGLGLVLFITAIVLLAVGTIRFAPPATAGRDVALLEAFAVYLAMMSLAIVWIGFGLPGGRVVGTSLTFGSFAAGIAWPFIRRAPGLTSADVRHALGLHAGRGVVSEVFFGVVGYIALFPLVVIGIVITATLSKLTGADASHPITELVVGPLWQFVLVALLAAVFAPITEELLFRGALFGHLRSRIPWFGAAVITSLIFASIHPQGWAGIPALSMIGLNLALLRQWRGSIIASIIAHALNNGTLVVLTGLMLR